MDYNFHGRILLGDTYNKHIALILVKYSWNFRKLLEWFSEFQWDDERRQNRKSTSSTDKKVEFQQDAHEASEFHIIGWDCYKWNNAALFLECKQEDLRGLKRLL